MRGEISLPTVKVCSATYDWNVHNPFGLRRLCIESSTCFGNYILVFDLPRDGVSDPSFVVCDDAIVTRIDFALTVPKKRYPTLSRASSLGALLPMLPARAHRLHE